MSGVTVISSGNILVVPPSDTAFNVEVIDNGAEILLPDGTAHQQYIGAQGYLADLGGKLNDVQIGNGGDLIISPFSQTTGPAFKDVNLVNGGTIDLTGLRYDPSDLSASISSNGLLSVTFTPDEHGGWGSGWGGDDDGKTIQVQLSGDYSGDKVILSKGFFGSVDLTLVCFLEGTRLRAGAEEIAVEDLRAGDMVTVLLDGDEVLKPVKWIGRRGFVVDPASEDSYPVRVRAHAFGAGVPHRDLLVTPEHCIFVDGRLIPVRMLVNGTSIVSDRSIGAYTYFHVELEEHGILIAEGLTAESYLDTGNRGNFSNSDLSDLRPDFSAGAAHKSWDAAAAPFTVERAIVEPIWHRLAVRALELGFAAPAMAALVEDPELRLVTEAGREIRPLRRDGNRYAFTVPNGTGALRIASRTARPCDVIGPFVDDRRRLGVRIGEIRVLDGRCQTVVRDHLVNTDLAGWHAIEPGTGRWTDGGALLPVELGDGPALVELQLVAAGPYRAAAEPRLALAS